MPSHSILTAHADQVHDRAKKMIFVGYLAHDEIHEMRTDLADQNDYLQYDPTLPVQPVTGEK